MAFLIPYATGDNNRVTTNMSASSAGKWAKDRARVASNYLGDDDGTFNSATSHPAYYALRIRFYTSSAMYHSGAQSAGIKKKYAHGPMWKYRKILKRESKYGNAYRDSGATATTVQA